MYSNSQFKMAKQMLDMQKDSVETMLRNLVAMWGQTAEFSQTADWLPEEGRKAILQWVEINRKACDGLKSALESSYSNLEKFFPS